MNRNDKEFIANKIRTQYVGRESTELDELRKLDRKVKKPVNVFAFVFESIGAIVMGSGMSLVMTDIGEITGIENALMWGIIIGVIGTLLLGTGLSCVMVWGSSTLLYVIGVCVGIAGIAALIAAYPAYKKITRKQREKIAPQIISLADELEK